MAKTSEPGRLVTTRHAAEVCGVHVNTIRKWIGQGRLRAYRVGPQQMRVDRDDLAALIMPVVPA
ncbi:MAG TPA: helix-turn-helix domain-containing protein [Mycobacterium sp.]|jgi:excisionase family DNA binding protein|nr:helix-turn-helix domain-containing protein [Mycobacterium sp.]